MFMDRFFFHGVETEWRVFGAIGSTALELKLWEVANEREWFLIKVSTQHVKVIAMMFFSFYKTDIWIPGSNFETQLWISSLGARLQPAKILPGRFYWVFELPVAHSFDFH